MPKLSGRKLFYSALILMAAIFGLGHVFPTAAQDLLFEGDFESGDLTGFYWYHNKPEAVTAPHPVRAGNYSMRSYLHRYESPYSYRTDVHVGSKDTNPPGTPHDAFQFDIGKEYWIGLSIFIPDGDEYDYHFEPDYEELDEILFQIQASPDPGESYRSPVFVIEVEHDRWEVTSRWDARPTSPSGNYFEGSETFYKQALGSSINKWTDWIIHVKWSYQSDGFLEIWRDGTMVASRTGPNCANDSQGPYPQMGVYKWPWNPDDPYDTVNDERLYYHDELRIAGADAGYDDVAPGGGSPPASPDSVHCPPLGDIDCSGRVNGIDFGCLVSHWGTANPQANLDDTGLVDSLDALILLGNYEHSAD